MHPILFKIGPFELRSWGVAIAASFLIATLVSMKRASRFGVKPDNVLDLAIVIMLSSIVGSRIWYVVNHLERFRGHWLDIINPFQHGRIGFAGFAMNGGIVLTLIASFLFIRIWKWNFLALADTIAPSFLLGAGIQRLGGCFLNGCCYGLSTDTVFGVTFPKKIGPFMAGTPLWPTQLFASALGFIGFALVCWFERRRARFSGSTFWVVLVYYSIERFFVDQFRYYNPIEIIGKLGPLTFNTNHFLIGGLFIISVGFLCRRWLKAKIPDSSV